MKRGYSLIILLSLAVMALDQLSKFCVVRAIRFYEHVPVINGFFDLVHVRNRGMAFGLMNRSDTGWASYLLAATAIGAVLLLIYWFARLRDNSWKVLVGFSLIIGGAGGNLIDRLRLKEVVDFLDFYIGPYHWPAFNLADSAITVGAFLLALHMLFSPSQHVP